MGRHESWSRVPDAVAVWTASAVLASLLSVLVGFRTGPGRLFLLVTVFIATIAALVRFERRPPTPRDAQWALAGGVAGWLGVAAWSAWLTASSTIHWSAAFWLFAVGLWPLVAGGLFACAAFLGAYVGRLRPRD